MQNPPDFAEKIGKSLDKSAAGGGCAPGTGYAPQAVPSKSDDYAKENIAIVERHGYTQFHETDGARYYKHPDTGTTTTLYNNGSWMHSGAGDTLKGSNGRELRERLLKYHHEMVPKASD
ncbi:MAG TPA: hypothetical protein VN946_05420 [Terriglobales bacterium]|jgi:predicted RNA binding protein YcfA (HicA-like mRNA interferase family)|nr:hypothetical protein [Terriglobales bacterium]